MLAYSPTCLGLLDGNGRKAYPKIIRLVAKVYLKTITLLYVVACNDPRKVCQTGAGPPPSVWPEPPTFSWQQDLVLDRLESSSCPYVHLSFYIEDQRLNHLGTIFRMLVAHGHLLLLALFFKIFVGTKPLRFLFIYSFLLQKSYSCSVWGVIVIRIDNIVNDIKRHENLVFKFIVSCRVVSCCYRVDSQIIVSYRIVSC